MTNKINKKLFVITYGLKITRCPLGGTAPLKFQEYLALGKYTTSKFSSPPNIRGGHTLIINLQIISLNLIGVSHQPYCPILVKIILVERKLKHFFQSLVIVTQ